MEEQRMDILIESIETVSNDIEKINFELEGLKEDIERIEEKQPYMTRQLALNERKMNKLFKQANLKMSEKQSLEAEFGTLKMKADSEKKEKEGKKTEPGETPKSVPLTDKPK
jgi:chromosome segregation ATPase